MRDSHRTVSINHNFEERGEPERNRTEVLQLYQTNALPLGQTDSDTAVCDLYFTDPPHFCARIKQSLSVEKAAGLVLTLHTRTYIYIYIYMCVCVCVCVCVCTHARVFVVVVVVLGREGS